jgi:O-antigen/teichoic acid export membrane protein
VQETERKIPSLKTQSGWLLFAKSVGFAFAFLLPLLVVRFLDRADVGLYRQSFLVVTNAAAILSFGFAMSAYYYLARERENRPAAMVNILAFHFLTGGAAFAVLFFFPQILGSIFDSAEMTLLAPKIGLVIWIWIFSSVLETVAVANREPRVATVFIIFAQLGKTLLMSLAVILFRSVEAFLYAAMIQGALQSLVLLVYLNSRFPRFWRSFRFAFFREHFAYAVPFGLSGVLWILMSDIHNYFVGHKFSDAEYAIYAYGCFEIPLISSLWESVTSVLIPRMSELEMRSDRREMIRLTARAIQKLAFVFFPLYVFLFITADTFITTLFTADYAASVPIYRINLTLLLLLVLVTDPVVRAFPDLGRFMFKLRIFLLAGMVSALYFGLEHFSMSGMIAVVVVIAVIEKAISETVVVKKLGVTWRDFGLLKPVAKTAFASLLAGAVMFAFYWAARDAVFSFAQSFLQSALPHLKIGIINFAAGGATLLTAFLIFVPVYLLLMHFWKAIDEEDKNFVKKVLGGRWSAVSEKLTAKKKTADHRPLTTDH